MTLLLLLLCALPACERGQAPRDWAVRHGADTGAPAPNRDAEVAHTDVRPGQDRFWIGLTTALVGIIGIATGLGVWLLEARRRLRRGAETTAHAIVDRLRREHVVSNLTVDRGPIPLWIGDVELRLRGAVTSEAERRRAVEIAEDEARRDRIPPRIVDRLSIDPALRRAAG